MTTAAIERPKLNPRQERFCHEYVKDLDPRAALVRAGYSARTADSQASQLLKLPQVREFLAKLQKPRLEKSNIAADRTLSELAAIGFSDLSGIYDPETREIRHILDMPPAVRASIASIEVTESGLGDGERVTKFKLWDKVAALDKLARHLGILKEALQVNIALDNDLSEVPESELIAAIKRYKDKHGANAVTRIP